MSEFFHYKSLNPISLLKLFIKKGKNENEVETFLNQPNQEIPNSVPISKLREQVNRLSQIQFSNHGKVDKSIISQLLFHHNENFDETYSKLSDRTFDLEEFRLTHCQNIVQDDNLSQLNNVLWYYYQTLPYPIQKTIFRVFDFFQQPEFLPKAIEFPMHNKIDDFENSLIEYLKELSHWNDSFERITY